MIKKKQGVKVRAARRSDLEQMYQCECACFEDPWSFPMLYEEVCENRSAVYLVLLVNGRVVGYCGANIVLDESHVMNMCVLPDYRGKGYAKLMMRALQDASKERGADAMTLEVRTSNRAALRLYKDCGFTIQGLRKNYYNGREDAYVMWTRRPAYVPESPAFRTEGSAV